MNVLWVSPWLPGPLRPRSTGLLRALAARGHRITLVGLDLAEPIASLPQEVVCHPVRVRPMESRVRAAIAAVTGKSLTTAWGAEPQWKQLVAELLARGGWDLVHCEHVRGTAGLPDAVEIPVVWDAVDCMSDLYRRLARSARNSFASGWRSREADALELLERDWLTRADAVVCATPREGELLRKLGAKSAPVVVPNGVYIPCEGVSGPGPGTQREIFRDASGLAGARPTVEVPEKTGPVVICTGKWRHPPNREAVDWVLESIWPRIRAAIPGTQLWISGAAPPRSWRRNAVVGGVHILADVPDMAAVLACADVALCAMITPAGVQNKLLEAIAAGLPVVATPGSVGPLQGAVDCGAVAVAERPDDIASAVVEWLSQPDRAREAGESGRIWVSRECPWDRSASLLEAVWHRVLA